MSSVYGSRLIYPCFKEYAMFNFHKLDKDSFYHIEARLA